MKIIDRKSLPIIIISFNQLNYLRQLLSWLVESGHENILILDNNSSYPPLIEFFSHCPHDIIRLKNNMGHKAPWESGLVSKFDTCFAVTDPDILPDTNCPVDAIEYFQELLLRHQEFDKAGFGLILEDLPDIYPHREIVRKWESPFWKKTVESGVYIAHIDTTFAVCRPGTSYKVTESLRTGTPYLARHLPWYGDPRKPNEETAYFYNARREDIGYWNRVELPFKTGQGEIDHE